MKETLEPFFKLLTMLVGLLLGVTLLTAVLIGAFVMVLDRNVSKPTDHIPSNLKTFTVPKVDTYQGVISKEGIWQAPDWSLVDEEPNAESIKYGKELIANTSVYLGPNGKVKQISNGMNCQNCHINAGTVILGNNYSEVASTYPKIRARSGHLEDIPKRVNDCFERSLNGKALDIESKEMVAIVAYLVWLGKDVPKGEVPKGAGIYQLPYLERAADPIKGKTVYAQHCQSCHQENGQGIPKADQSGHIYPPLWGDHSYNSGAGLVRISRFAGYVKTNMPLGATFERPILTDEESWDVAAYVNSQARPKKETDHDWPNISQKPIDHPYAPYSDGFSESQHKYGPFIPIQKEKKSNK